MGLFSDKIRVGVLRGGPSPEYEVSIATGAQVMESLDKDIYEPIDIFISRGGAWHLQGFEKTPQKVLGQVDVVWNALHGEYGEDGTVQKVLSQVGIPFTGSGAVGSALGMNKISTKEYYKRHGLRTPAGVAINLSQLTRDKIREVFKLVPAPFVVKPVNGGSSVGVHLAHSLPELEEAVIDAFSYSPAVLIEEFIAGKEATCGVVDEWRGNKHHALLPIEIRQRENPDAVFDYKSKYSDNIVDEICPGNFTQEEKDEIEAAAIMAHGVLGLRHYSGSDFRIHPKRGVFIIETNTLPGLTRHSLIPKSLHAAGAKLSDFLHHIISLALKHK